MLKALEASGTLAAPSSTGGLHWNRVAWRLTESALHAAARRCGRWYERASTAALIADFEVRPDDIFIATYPRSGTTWLQMLLYQLLHGPNLDFEHINDVCPWFERGKLGAAAERARTLARYEQLPSPRIFKTHLPYDRLRGLRCRFVYATRDGLDVARSNYHFVSHGEPDFGSFFRHHFLTGCLHAGGGSWFSHVARWQANPERRRVLYVRYEDLRADLTQCARALNEFCGARRSPAELEELLALCSFEAMKRHESKFDYLAAMVLENKRTTEGYAFLRNGGRAEPPLPLSEADQRAYQRQLEQHGLAR